MFEFLDEYCSDKGRETVRRAHFKYVSVLKLYIKENYPTLTNEDKIKRFRAFLDFLKVLKVCSFLKMYDFSFRTSPTFTITAWELRF